MQSVLPEGIKGGESVDARQNAQQVGYQEVPSLVACNPPPVILVDPAAGRVKKQSLNRSTIANLQKRADSIFSAATPNHNHNSAAQCNPVHQNLESYEGCKNGALLA